MIPDTKPEDGLGEATLKPCPFGCVHAFLPAVDMSPDDDRYVYCTVCGACAQREVWEKRPIEDALTQRVKVLEEALKEIIGGVDYYEEPHEARFIAERALAQPL